MYQKRPNFETKNSIKGIIKYKITFYLHGAFCGRSACFENTASLILTKGLGIDQGAGKLPLSERRNVVRDMMGAPEDKAGLFSLLMRGLGPRAPTQMWIPKMSFFFRMYFLLLKNKNKWKTAL